MVTATSNLQKENPIGIFDSGIGGLTVANEIQSQLPNEQIVYFGDTAHLPYGDKAAYSIKHYSTEITNFLLSKGCKLIVIACHTASSTAFKEVVETANGKALIVNVIDPVIELYKSQKADRNVGVIGTKGTIKTGVYRKSIQALGNQSSVKSLATPLLCPMIEEGFIDDKISQTVINSYLSDHRLSGIDDIILACTHYPLIKNQIANFYNQQVDVIDSAEVVAFYVKRLLQEKALENDQLRAPHHFFVSDYTKSFEKSTRFFFKEEIKLEKGSIWS